MTLTFGLYAWLSLVRVRAVRRGQVTYGAFEFEGREPPHIARISRNLGNQFELPVFFYVAILALMQLGAVGPLDLLFGWVFVVGRVLHTGVQTLTDRVRLRGLVFTINALAVFGLIAHLAWVVLGDFH